MPSVCLLFVGLYYVVMFEMFMYITLLRLTCRFNKKPKRGLAYLQQQGLLGPSAEDVAELFHNDDRLNKTLVGDFMGENEK